MSVSIISLILGTFLVTTALFKAFFSRLFIIHIRNLRFLPDQPSALAALLLIEIEAGLGVALILRAYPDVVTPVTFGLLVLTTAVTWWGRVYQGISHCGCYGAFLQLSIGQTTLVNGICLSGLGVIWYRSPPDGIAGVRGAWIIIAAVLVVHFMARKTVHKPLIDLLALKRNHDWNSGLVSLNIEVEGDQNRLFFFLNRDCQICQKWLARLEEITPEAVCCRMILVFPEGAGLDSNAEGSYPVVDSIHQVKPIVFTLLTGRIPTAVLVEKAMIRDVWVNEFPHEMLCL